MRSEPHGLRHGLQDVARFAGSERKRVFLAQAISLKAFRGRVHEAGKCRNSRARAGRPCYGFSQFACGMYQLGWAASVSNRKDLTGR
jgi:hypothetical protein